MTSLLPAGRISMLNSGSTATMLLSFQAGWGNIATSKIPLLEPSEQHRPGFMARSRCRSWLPL